MKGEILFREVKKQGESGAVIYVPKVWRGDTIKLVNQGKADKDWEKKTTEG